MIGRLRALYEEFPRQFWLLIGVVFIDMVGNALVFPFLALFITHKFDVGMTQVGVIFAILAATGLVGSTVGGALADRMGRKPILLAALVVSALGNLTLVLVPTFELLYGLAFLVGIFGSIGGPAAQAIIADLLPEEKRAEGFGLIRIIANLAVTFGPMIGGLLAGVSYLLLFSIDAATSLITAFFLLLFLRETKPEDDPDTPQETLAQTFRGYGHVLRDLAFMSFALIGVVVQLVYAQMNTTLSVYLRDVHDIAPQGFGFIISLNAMMVVLLQLLVTRRVKRYPPLLVMADGTLLYAVGFGLYGVVSLYVLFLVAMAIITVGEMMIAPVGQALAARFARDDMRGRYMAVYGFSFRIAVGMGTFLAGLIMDYADPRWVWYLAGVGGVVAALGYVLLYRQVRASAPEPAPVDEAAVPPAVTPSEA